METQATDTAEFYRRWAAAEARGSSPTYERLCHAVAGSAQALEFLHTLPQPKRQPNLLLGALRWLDAPVADPDAVLAFLASHADQMREVMLSRATQTNEASRCAVLLPALALLPEPLAVLELGASAGLCLMLDAWSYTWTDAHGTPTRCGSGPVQLAAQVHGSAPLPTAVPAIAARLGLDAHPVDVTDPDQRRWLECLVWPEHTDRAERLRRALDRAAATPPPVQQGLFPADVPAAVDQLRQFEPDATVVVMHSAAAAYLDTAGRSELAATLTELGVHRLGLEGGQVSVDLGVRGVPTEIAGRFVLSLDGRTLGTAHPHGRDLHWLADEPTGGLPPVQ
ncbi:MAG TPA: DUF2332 domain-containing protein [Candidatus Ruania gallistercoris]|uniref:DUF2332 domain-containing protein n=1 Tax=Candidatus Ruania gallistercoris TaxID=2838746 RepID=A0A9D2EHP5_9MICO|nr:DUF2332 domain-containing protein [Candidatus Ruania gallistercoris]